MFSVVYADQYSEYLKLHTAHTESLTAAVMAAHMAREHPYVFLCNGVAGRDGQGLNPIYVVEMGEPDVKHDVDCELVWFHGQWHYYGEQANWY